MTTMITAYPGGHEYARGRRAIGYWGTAEGQTLPMPQAFVDATWDPAEKAMVLSYLQIAFARALVEYRNEESLESIYIGWRGFAPCRFPRCGTYHARLGSACVGDDVFIWPEGFAHYLDKHHVRPAQEFIDHVRLKTAGTL